MKFLSITAIFFLTTTALVAKPLDVFFVGKQDRILALFKKGIEEGSYDFLTIEKKDLVSPRLKVPHMSDLPKELRTPKAEYKVMTALIIDKAGKVLEVALVETSDERLVSIATADASQWVFKPATRDGKPVACCVFAPLEYKIKSWDEIIK